MYSGRTLCRMWTTRTFFTILLILYEENCQDTEGAQDNATLTYNKMKMHIYDWTLSRKVSNVSSTHQTSGINQIYENNWTLQKFSSSVTEAIPVETRAKTLLLFKIGQVFNKYWTPLIILIGLPGNFLAFLVLRKKENRRISTCVYMSALCISDTSLPCILAFVYYVYAWPGWPMLYQDLDYYIIVCKLLTFFARAQLQFGSYIILFLSLDRFIIVHYPLKSKIISTPRKSMAIILLLLLFAFGYNSHNYFWTKAFPNAICVAYYGSSTEMKVFSWLSIILNWLIPFSVLIVLNVSLIRTIKNRPLDFLEAIKSSRRSMSAIERQLSRMSVIICSIFLICFTPANIRYIYTPFIDTSKDPKLCAAFSFFYHFSHRLLYTNSAINFFIYFISGHKFRSDLKKIVWHICCYIKRSRHGNVTSPPDSPGYVSHVTSPPDSPGYVSHGSSQSEHDISTPDVVITSF